MILFFSLIFNEIIEINFFGLSDNTKKNIIQRAQNEENFIYKSETIDENDIVEKDENIIELKDEDIYSQDT